MLFRSNESHADDDLEGYDSFAKEEKRLSKILSTRARNWVLNIESVVERLSKLDHNEKIDYKKMDTVIKMHVDVIADARKVLDPFKPANQVVQDLKMAGMKK